MPTNWFSIKPLKVFCRGAESNRVWAVGTGCFSRFAPGLLTILGERDLVPADQRRVDQRAQQLAVFLQGRGGVQGRRGEVPTVFDSPAEPSALQCASDSWLLSCLQPGSGVCQLLPFALGNKLSVGRKAQLVGDFWLGLGAVEPCCVLQGTSLGDCQMLMKIASLHSLPPVGQSFRNAPVCR